MVSQEGPEMVYTRQEAARLARLSLTSLDEALRRGVFPFLKIGKRVLIPKAAFLKVLTAGQ
jgi:excisionase family DNA binding protein